MNAHWWLAAGLVCLMGILLPAEPLAAADDPPALKVGDKAPDIDLPAVRPGSKSHQLRLSDFHGKKNVVLYFYPKALTGG